LTEIWHAKDVKQWHMKNTRSTKFNIS